MENIDNVMGNIDNKRTEIINNIIKKFVGPWYSRSSDLNCEGCVISNAGIIMKPFIHINTIYIIIYYEKDQSDIDIMSNHATVHNYECYIIKDEKKNYFTVLSKQMEMDNKQDFIEKLVTINATRALNGEPIKRFTGQITYEMSYTELRF